MKPLTLALLLTVTTTASAVCNTEPALELRNAFISQYASRGSTKGQAIDEGAKQAGCLFDMMASRLTVNAYIEVVKSIRSNGKPTKELEAILPEARKACFAKG